MSLRTALISLSIGLAWLLPHAALAQDSYQPRPYSATYSVHMGGFKVGELTRELRMEANGNYVLEQQMQTTGIVAFFKKDRVLERSTWRYQNDQPVAMGYYAHYTGRAKDAVERMDFDWTRNIATSLDGGETREISLTPGVQDKLGHQITLIKDIVRGMERIEYQIADRGKLRPYIYEVRGTEQVVTARGTVRTIKVQKGTTTFWLAPEWNYLLVKLVQKNKDGTVASYIQAN